MQAHKPSHRLSTSAASGRTSLPAVSPSSRTPEHLALALPTTGPAGETCVHEETYSLDDLTSATDSSSPVAIHGQGPAVHRVSRQVLLQIGRADSLACTPTVDRGFKRTAMLAPPFPLQRRQTASRRISISQLLADLKHELTKRQQKASQKEPIRCSCRSLGALRTNHRDRRR